MKIKGLVSIVAVTALLASACGADPLGPARELADAGDAAAAVAAYDELLTGDELTAEQRGLASSERQLNRFQVAADLADAGESADAVAAYDELLADDLTADRRGVALLERGQLHLGATNLDLAQTDFFQAADVTESNEELGLQVVDALVELAADFMDVDDFPAAIEVADRGLSLQADNAALFRTRGTAHLELREFEAAINDLRAGLQIEADGIAAENSSATLAVAYYRFANALSGLGDYPAAIDAYDQSIDSTSQEDIQSLALAQKAFVLQETGRHEEAKDNLDQALDLDPNNATAYTYRAYYYIDSGRYGLAIADADRVLKPQTSGIDLGDNLSKYLDLDSLRLPTDLADEGIKATPEDRSLALFARALAKTNQGDNRGALADISDSIGISARLEDPSPRSYRLRAEIKIALGQHESAIADATTAVENGTEDLPALGNFYRTRAKALLGAGQFDAALDDAEAAIGLGDNDVSSLEVQGEIREAQGDIAGAVASYEAAIAVAPDDPWLRHWLAEIHRRANDYQSAETRYTEALQLDPNQAAFHTGIGFNLLLQDRIAEAAVALTESISLDETDPFAFYLRGFSNYASSNNADARSDLNEALRLAGPDHPLADEINSLLTELG